ETRDTRHGNKSNLVCRVSCLVSDRRRRILSHMPPIPVIVGVVLSYLLGSVPFGVIVGRARGVDIFKAGSGNIGATNVGRVLGRKSGVLVFVLDFLKGALPTAIMYLAFGVTAGVAAGLAAFLGHLFPAYLRFHGGKGVATGFGVTLVLLPGPTA